MNNSSNRPSRRKLFSMAGAAAVAATSGSAAAAVAPAGDSYRLTRDVPVERGSDVVVAGGGPAGAAAAICAARLGAKLLLLEAMGSMGGMGANAIVSSWYSVGNGERLVIGGLIRDIVASLCRDKQAAPAVSGAFAQGRYFDAIGFRPEALELLLHRLCRKAGVEVRDFTRVVDAELDASTRQPEGIVTNNVEGFRSIAARAFLDCTGDTVLTTLCGAKVRTAGVDTPKIMPPTLCATVTNIDFARFRPGRPQALVEKAIAEGYFSQPDRHVPGVFRNGPHSAMLNTGHIFNTDATRCGSLSGAMMRGRELAEEYAGFFRRYMPGCEQMDVTGTGTPLGVRESRRIAGEYEVNYQDIQARRHFPHQIAVYCKALDIHVYDLSPEDYKRDYEEYNQLDRPRKGESYGLPYGMLVPKGWRDLWVAGRCSSSGIKVNGAIRDQPACFMLGQAAGTAAAQSIRTGQAANELDTEQLVSTLRGAGGYLPQPSLTRTMTRDRRGRCCWRQPWPRPSRAVAPSTGSPASRRASACSTGPPPRASSWKSATGASPSSPPYPAGGTLRCSSCRPLKPLSTPAPMPPSSVAGSGRIHLAANQ